MNNFNWKPSREAELRIASARDIIDRLALDHDERWILEHVTTAAAQALAHECTGPSIQKLLTDIEK